MFLIRMELKMTESLREDKSKVKKNLRHSELTMCKDIWLSKHKFKYILKHKKYPPIRDTLQENVVDLLIVHGDLVT